MLATWMLWPPVSPVWLQDIFTVGHCDPHLKFLSGNTGNTTNRDSISFGMPLFMSKLLCVVSIVISYRIIIPQKPLYVSWNFVQAPTFVRVAGKRCYRRWLNHWRGTTLSVLALGGGGLLASTGVVGRWALLLPSVLKNQSQQSYCHSYLSVKILSLSKASKHHIHLIVTAINLICVSIIHLTVITANDNCFFDNYDIKQFIHIISSIQN